MNTIMNPIGPDQLDKLRVTAGEGPVLILTHDNPDPDGLASGKALSILLREAWNIPSQLVYSGLVRRAENHVMLNRLTPEWEGCEILPDLGQFSAVAQIDTQPGAGNNHIRVTHPNHIVIDHHYPMREATTNASYADVRPDIGSTVTMLFQYLEAAGVEPGPRLATAMYYGLKTDTRSLTRGESVADDVAFMNLTRYLDQRELSRVEVAALSLEYFRAFSHGLHAARLFGQAVVAWLGSIDQPDFAAEMADILIRLQGARAALCMGQFRDTLHISLRTGGRDQDAGLIIQQIVSSPGSAGGHGTMAGGQFPLLGVEMDSLLAEIQHRFLTVLSETGEGIALIV